ncbi:glycosyltransferase family 2 protein [Brevibacterium renqingii]|uniref:glycosyltransferase family 2 protein n=1 Tax=Brevibacterium renqingii TaxID=2776916 RepID=UPI001FE495F9|nr:glycosyltransferase family 2 protein [Brevibacterium renqingii]
MTVTLPRGPGAGSEAMNAQARRCDEWGRVQDERRSAARIDVLIPTCDRPTELAVTLSGLAAQLDASFDVVISDQSQQPVADERGVRAMIDLLHAQGRHVDVDRNLPRRGMAQQRHHLVMLSSAEHLLCLDDDVWLEPGTLARMDSALTSAGCGFIGAAVQGLSFLDDRRPEEWTGFEEWEERVRPETPRSSGESGRWKLHNAANLSHIAVEKGFSIADPRLYHVDWVGGCVLFDRAKLLDSGGFGFWDQLPVDHVGEDVYCQRRVMSRYGGAGLIPSGAVHLESPTTLTERRCEVSEYLA